MSELAGAADIWVTKPDVGEMNLAGEDSLSGHLHIRFVEAGSDYIRASMPVSPDTLQPHGLLHGGASAAFAETVASHAGLYCVDREVQVVVGLALNINHIRSVTNGTVTATGRPLHLGRSTQVWNIDIHDDAGHMVASSRVTLAVIERR